MFQRDYILRLIEQMTAFIGTQIMQLKAEHKHEEALSLFGEQYGRLFMPRSQLLIRLSDEDILAMMSQNGELDEHKALMVGLLLKEEADLYNMLGKEEESYYRYIKSLFLLLILSEQRVVIEHVDYLTELDNVIIQLYKYSLPMNVLRLMAGYYESSGKYDQAENIYFELIIPQEGNEPLALSFYKRMLSKSDNELFIGGLPRSEIYEGIEALKLTSHIQ